MKLLLWSPKGAGKHYYGPGTNAYNLYRIAREDFDFELVLVHSNPSQQDNEIYDAVEQLGTDFQFSVFSLVSYLCRSFLILWRYRNKDYVFHGLDVYSSTFIPAIIAKLLGYKVCLKIASSPSGLSVSNRGLLSKLRAFFAHHVDRYFVISDEIKEELLRLGIEAKQLVMTYNGVDADHYTSEHKTYPLETLTTPADHSLTLLFTGAVCRRKQPHMLLEAVAACTSSIQWTVVLVGPVQDQVYFEEMQDFCRKEGITRRVQFLGYQSELRNYYYRADVYALPSLGEGMPNGVLEAMASALPIIITPFSSARLLCQAENGYIVEDLTEMVKALEELARSPVLRQNMGLVSRSIVEQKFSMESVACEYLNCFKELRRSCRDTYG
jgi:glycosyltransferase involved in cell wall biosynthesis